MSRRSFSAPLVAIAILAVLGAVVYIVVGRGSKREATSQEKAAPETVGQVPKTTPGGPAEAPPKRAGDGATVRKLANREARDRLLRAIAQARARRANGDWRAGAQSSSRPAPALKPPVLDRKYIQKTMRGVRGLLKECYELAVAETPDLAGRLVVKFEIEGEPEVGGIVSSAEVEKGEDSPLGKHPSLSECIRETVMSLELEPPANGGKVVVRYPFLFRSQP